MFGRALLISLLGLMTLGAAPRNKPAPASEQWVKACQDFDEWDKPGPPFRLYGQTYYVGTCGITSLLLASPKGHVLIDSGTDRGAEIVLANIRALGFDPRDVKVLLMSHEHFDHVGGMARLQAATGAAIIASPPAAETLRKGLPGGDDPQADAGHPPFPAVTGPITVLDAPLDQRIAGRVLSPISTPGHTPGAISWSWQECEKKNCRTIVYADSLNPISGDTYRFSDHKEYLAAFVGGLFTLSRRKCDMLVTPHPGSGDLRKRLANKGLIDPKGCANFAMTMRDRLTARLGKEREAK
jgi:metallo-beta-lactamase class B